MSLFNWLRTGTEQASQWMSDSQDLLSGNA